MMWNGSECVYTPAFIAELKGMNRALVRYLSNANAVNKRILAEDPKERLDALLNKLFGRKNLVKVSSTPGKTCNVNFFDVDGITFVDLPGYGFARVSKAEKDRWSDLIGGYFELERSFNLVVSLVDIRHEAQKLDRQMIAFLQDAGLPYLVVLTKGDKLSRNKQNAQAALSVADRGYVLETGKIVTTGTGAELLASPAIKKAYLGG